MISTGKIRIAIVDCHKTSREKLGLLLNTMDDFEIIWQASNVRQFLELLKTVTPDLVLMEIRMPEMDGMVATNKAMELHPGLKIIAYSQYPTERDVIDMNMRGVKSVIGKGEHPNELIKAIRIIHSGGVYMTDMAAAIVQKYLNRNQISCPVRVNEFELNLLKNICQGLSSTQIAGIICKSPRTVEKYREDLYRKFEVNSKEGLISFAVKWELV